MPSYYWFSNKVLSLNYINYLKPLQLQDFIPAPSSNRSLRFLVCGLFMTRATSKCIFASIAAQAMTLDAFFALYANARCAPVYSTILLILVYGARHVWSSSQKNNGIFCSTRYDTMTRFDSHTLAQFGRTQKIHIYFLWDYYWFSNKVLP